MADRVISAHSYLVIACITFMVLLPVSAPNAETLTWDYDDDFLDQLETWQETKILGTNWQRDVNPGGTGGERATLEEGDIISFNANLANDSDGDFDFKSLNASFGFEIATIRFESGREETTVGGVPFELSGSGSNNLGIVNVSGNNQIFGTGDSFFAFTTHIELVSEQIYLDGDIGINVGANSSVDIDLILSGDSIVKFGEGSLSLNHGNTYAGGTNIKEGTVIVSQSAALGTGTLKLNDSELEAVGGHIVLQNSTVLNDEGTFRVDGGSTLTLNGEISGDALTKKGSGRLILTHANTYTGDTTVNGELVSMTTNALSQGGLSLNSDAIVDLTNQNQTIEFLNGGNPDGEVKLGSGSLTIDTIEGNAPRTYYGLISGSFAGTLTKAGVGTQSFGGAVETGNLVITGGTVRLAEDDVISDSTGVTIFNDGALDLNSHTEEVNFIESDSTNAKLILGDAGILRLGGDEDKTFAGAISGNGESLLIKETSSDGTLTLSGDNSEFLGTVRLNGGTLKLGGGDNLSDSGEVELSAGTTLDLDGTNERLGGFFGDGGQIDVSGSSRLITGANDGDQAFAGTIDGAGSLEKIGSGTLNLSGVNTYSEGTFINGGTLEISADNNLGTGVISFDGGALDVGTHSVTIDRAITLESGGGTFANELNGTLSLDGVISGVGGLTKTGSGVTALGGANTYSGGTFINGGTLEITADNNLGASSGGLSFDGGTLDTGIKSVTIDRAITLESGGGTFAVDDAANKKTISLTGEISGTGGLTKTGTGTVALGALNTYSGDTRIKGGTLRQDVANATSEFSDVRISDGAVFDLNGNDAQIAALESADSGGDGGTVILDDKTLTLGRNGHDGTFSGTIEGNAGKLIKTGNGSQTLSGENTYSGGTSINGGTLKISSDNNLGASTGGLSFDDGTLDTGDNAVTIDHAITLESGGGTFAVDNKVVVGGTVSKNIRLDGGISGSGGLTKTGSGSVVLSGVNTYSGDTKIKDGRLLLFSSNGTSASSDVILSDGTQFTLFGNDASIGALRSAGSGGDGGSVLLSDGALTLGSNDGSATFRGIISGDGGTLTKTGTGTQTLSGANTYSGGTFFNGGTLEITADNNLGAASGGLSFDGGTLDTGTTSVTIDRAITVLNDGGATFAVDDGTLSKTISLVGGISGTGGLTKTGTGRLELDGVNTYSGDTEIKNGRLLVASSDATSASSDVILSNGTQFRLSGESAAIGALKSADSGGDGGSVRLGNGGSLTLGSNDGSGSFRGVISGTDGALTKTGTGTQTLAGENTYSGGTFINGGTVKITADNNLGASSGGLSFDGGTLDTGTKSVTIDRAINLLDGGGTFAVDDAANNKTISLTGEVSGTGGLTKSGSGTVALSGANTYSGGTFINGGTVEITADNNLGASSGGLSFDGGALDTGTKSLTIDRAITLQNGGATFAVDNAANNKTISLTGEISGTGGLTKTGTGTVALGGANTYSGETQVKKGTLALAGDGSFASSTVTVDSGATFDVSARTGAGPISSNLFINGRVDGSNSTAQIFDGGIENQGIVNGGAAGLTLKGPVFGAGSYEGKVIFDGAFGPGNSPALIGAQDLVFGANNELSMEVGGLTRGSEYDAFDAMSVALGGTLDIALLNGFIPSAGDFFDLFIAEQITGDFDTFNFAALSGGLFFDTQFISSGANTIYQLIVVQSQSSSVPEPATLFIVLVGLAGAAAAAKRRPRKT
jgi:fibronectin-binding autotransporter adhesin